MAKTAPLKVSESCDKIRKLLFIKRRREMTSASKRSIMTLFADKNDIYSHQVRIVLAEKGVPYEVENIERGAINEDLLAHNPRGSIPTLADREVTLFDAHIIMEYLDERFPHPPLMPVFPQKRGKYRLMMRNIKQDWYALIEVASRNPESKEGKKALATLKEEVLATGPFFAQHEFFMSDEFSLPDCYIAPLLWKMVNLGVDFGSAKGAKAVKAYMNRVFQRESFKQSIAGSVPKHLMDDKD